MKILENTDLCTGCSACANVCPKKCITMKPDEEGFLRPYIDETQCVECQLCRKTCPINDETQSAPMIQEAFACHAKNEELIRQSSSGGVFSLLCQQILDKGGVVFGAAFDTPDRVCHIAVESKDELYRLRGSKYVQSEIGETFSQAKQFLKNGRWVLFSGVPCQIGGLKRYLGREYDTLVCVDTICHSMPSPKSWKAFLQENEKQESSTVTKANFREKKNGWEKYDLHLQFENGHEKRYPAPENWYMRAFISGLSTRKSCYRCAFKGDHHCSDLSLGDFWGVRQAAPETLHESGTSLVLVHTEKGKQWLQSCKDQMVLASVDFETAIQPNPAYKVCAKPHKNRNDFFAKVQIVPFVELVQQCLKPSLKEQIAERIRWSFPARVLRRIKKSLFKR